MDYSESSLPTLEYIIEQAHQQFNGNKVKGKITNETALNRTASVWGSYLGELIRKKLGGTWIIEESIRWLVVNGLRCSPIDFVYQRITGRLQDNVSQYFDEVVKKLSSPPISFVRPAPNLPNSTYTPTQSEAESSKAIVQPLNISNNRNKSFPVERILQIVLGVAVLGLLVGAASWLYSSKISGPAKATQQAIACQEEFKNDMTRLLSDFFRQQSIADVTARINLPEQTARLEDIRRDAWNIPSQSCESHLHALLMDYMDKSITSYIGFSAEDDDATLLQKYDDMINALVSLDDATKALGYSGGLVELFRDKGYFYWEKLNEPNWRSTG